MTQRGQAKVLDFGLAKLLLPLSEATLTESLTETQAMAGTLPYMAPEQLRGEQVDARTDIYALGAVLYEMATGRRPFEAALPTALAADIQHKAPAPPGRLNPDLSPKLEDIILKCLEKDPERRFQSAKELAVDLRRLAVPSSVTTAAPAGRAQRAGWKAALPAAYAAAGLLVLVAVLLALNVGEWRAWLLGRAASPPIESLAVLPLENLSRDPEQEYFADGMTEALITDLSKIGSLKVISRTSVMRYKRTDKALPQIARELGVDAVIEGSVLREGNQVRISVQLIHGATDKHLWADNYQRELRSILALQSDVARAIASEIKAKLTPQEQVRLAKVRPVNPEAHEAYLRGHYYLQKFSPDGMRNAIAYFNQAIQKDPSNALAYAGLSRAYRVVLAPKEGTLKARAAAEKALELDDTLGEAHAALANIKFRVDWDFPGAEREFKRAIELSPSYGEARHLYSHYLAAMGRFNESSLESRRFLELDPLSTASNVHLGWHYLVTRQYDQAIDQYRKSIQMDPNFVEARIQIGLAYLAKKMYPEALAELQKATELSQGGAEYMARLGYAYGIANKRASAEKILGELMEQGKKTYVSPYFIAVVYAGLGEKDRAFEWLGRAYEEHFGAVTDLKVYPEFEGLHSDARFQDLLRRIGLPP